MHNITGGAGEPVPSRFLSFQGIPLSSRGPIIGTLPLPRNQRQNRTVSLAAWLGKKRELRKKRSAGKSGGIRTENLVVKFQVMIKGLVSSCDLFHAAFQSECRASVHRSWYPGVTGQRVLATRDCHPIRVSLAPKWGSTPGTPA